MQLDGMQYLLLLHVCFGWETTWANGFIINAGHCLLKPRDSVWDIKVIFILLTRFWSRDECLLKVQKELKWLPYCHEMLWSRSQNRSKFLGLLLISSFTLSHDFIFIFKLFANEYPWSITPAFLIVHPHFILDKILEIWRLNLKQVINKSILHKKLEHRSM